MKSAQHHLNQQAALAESLHRAGRAALCAIILAAALLIANSIPTTTPCW